MPFIVFEGLDGSGKSSLIAAVNAELQKGGIKTFLSREPGGTPLGEEIRELILRNRLDASQAPTARAELLLYEASRHQHVERVIKPQLAAGSWVLCDRFTASSLAFQGQGREISWEDVHWLNQFATEGLQPDLTFLIDVSLETSQQRMSKRHDDVHRANGVHQAHTTPTAEAVLSSKKDRIENEGAAFYTKVREGFLRAAKITSDRTCILEGENTIAALTQTVLQEIDKRAWRKRG